jgi:hypothetical protein
MKRFAYRAVLLTIPVLSFCWLADASTLSGLVGNGIIHLRWTQNTEGGLEGYKVYYGTASGVYDGSTADQGASPITVPVAGFSDPANPECSLTSLSNGVPHYFQVKAVVSGMETDESNEISLTPAGWPAQLTASNPFQNPGFENDFTAWNCQWSSGTINSYIDTNIKLFGSKSLKVVSTNTTPGIYQISG